MLRGSALEVGQWLHDIPKDMGPQPWGPRYPRAPAPYVLQTQRQSCKTHCGLGKCKHHLPPFFTDCKPPRFCSCLIGRKLSILVEENKYKKYFLFIQFLKRFLLESFENVYRLFLPSKTKKMGAIISIKTNVRSPSP